MSNLIFMYIFLGWRMSKVREAIKDEFGREFVDKIFETSNETAYENVPIVNDEELKQRGLYEPYTRRPSNTTSYEQKRKPTLNNTNTKRDSLLEHSLVNLLQELEYVGQGSKFPL
jgi:hypothetical protein